MADYDAIIIGAGHNGLVAANVLAKSGAKVLVLERAHFLGGMAATRELFDGYKHSVGAWAVLIWRQEMTDRLELTKWGFELMDQWTSTCTFGAPEDTPFVMYNDLERMGRHLHRGPRTRRRRGPGRIVRPHRPVRAVFRRLGVRSRRWTSSR